MLFDYLLGLVRADWFLLGAERGHRLQIVFFEQVVHQLLFFEDFEFLFRIGWLPRGTDVLGEILVVLAVFLWLLGGFFALDLLILLL